jgi:hypothetical protein
VLIEHFEFTAKLGAKQALAIVVGAAFACLVIVNGVLLTFRPDVFLAFYDCQNPGDFWGKDASWRRNVHNTEYKVLGVVLLLSGLVFLVLLARVLLNK